ncbi:Amino acid/peptide transporter [Apilactobacillus kunkeei]|uniref:peptide MFS transporter n=1 Tax=Apilactobacillus kunkeei TaxID=148814 RepID=UPI0006B23BB9|nr:oligopeptide:H+ symporter [Apilactobacillus kunkeei]KOY74797.1 Amino acid/peptide transporter [Apilactobacillus kunkeei]KOY78140.1 Amino acid/peptide transporter [Apilactobacillus kunkeei]
MDKIDNDNQSKGLISLTLTESLERFSYYGMQAILLYYMYYSLSRGGLGFKPSTAASLFAIYGSLSYLSAACGGYISDRILGGKRTVSLGAILIIFGQLILTIPLHNSIWLLFISLVFLTVGTGLLKPTITTMVGNLYDEQYNTRAYRFTIFLSGINIGAFLAPIIIGYIGVHVNFHLGFLIGAIAMAIGLAIFERHTKDYNQNNSIYTLNPIEPYEIKKLLDRVMLFVVSISLVFLLMYVFDALNLENIITLLSAITIIIPFIYFFVIISSNHTSQKERKGMVVYVILFICASFFWGVEEQGPIVLAMMASGSTDNDFYVWKYAVLAFFIVASLIIGYFVQKKSNSALLKTFTAAILLFFILLGIFHNGDFHVHISRTWYQAINPLFILIFTPLFAKYWHHRESNALKSFPLGVFLASIGCLILFIPIKFLAGSEVNPLWIIATVGMVCLGEMLIYPVGLSVTYRLAPKNFLSQMMGVWYLSAATGQAINSQVVKYFSVDNVNYFLVLGSIGIVLSIVMVILLHQVLRDLHISRKIKKSA